MVKYEPKNANEDPPMSFLKAADRIAATFILMVFSSCVILFLVFIGILNIPFYSCSTHHDPNATVIDSASGPIKLLSPVVDTALVMSSGHRGTFKSLSNDLLKDSGVQFVVVTVDHLGQESIQSLASRTFHRWQLGIKGDDKGILFLLAVQERRVWIEVGYGLEGVLPDIVVYRLLEKHGHLLKNSDFDDFIEKVACNVRLLLSDAGYRPNPAPAAKNDLTLWDAFKRIPAASCASQSMVHQDLRALYMVYLVRAWFWLFIASRIINVVSSRSPLFRARMTARTRSRDHLTLNGFTERDQIATPAYSMGLYHAVRVLATITCALGLHKKLGKFRLRRSLANVFWDMLWIIWHKDLRMPVSRAGNPGSSGSDGGGGSSCGDSGGYGGGGGDSGGGGAGH